MNTLLQDIRFGVRQLVKQPLFSGVAVGTPVALNVSRVMRSVVYGVTPYDPVTIIASATLLILVAALAAWIPARRAAKTDPMVALRYE